MFKISSLITLFAVSTYIPIGGVFLFKKNKYESNYLISVNENYAKIIFNKKSFKKLNLKVENYFSFKLKGEIKKIKINEIKSDDENYEIIFESFFEKDDQKPRIHDIYYFLEKKSFWDEIL